MSEKACVDCGTGISIKATRCNRCAVEHHRGGIDRTPKPCLHKRANHQHGTNAAYVLDKCRCPPCCQARRAQDDWRRRQQAYGRYDKYVPAEPVRQHVRDLMAQGMGWKRVAETAGVSGSSMWKLLYGKTKPDGSRLPSKRITRANAEALLAVTLDLADGAILEEAPGVQLRLRALVALGWSMSKLAAHLGVTPTNAGPLFHGTRGVTVGTRRAVEALYEELSMRLPSEDTHRDKIAASRARRYAQQHGWLPPLALDDERLDDPGYRPILTREPEAEPVLDEAAIYRRMHGERVRLTKAEAAEVVRRWASSGRPLAECERVTGIKPDRHYRLRDQEAS